MAHERNRGLGSFSAQFRMNEDIMTPIMPSPSNFEVLLHHDDAGGFLDPTNQDHDSLYTTSCHAEQHEKVTEQGPLALSRCEKVESVNPRLVSHHHRGHHDHHYQRGKHCDTTRSSNTNSTSSDLKTQLRARNANIVRRALQLSNDDCLPVEDTTAIMTPEKTKKVLVVQQSKGRGREANQHGDHESTSGEGNLEHSFHLSALASALPLCDLGEELWQSELSYLFGPVGPAFGGRGSERPKTKNGRKRELSLFPDTETLGQQESIPNYDTTGELPMDKTTSGPPTSTKLSSSPEDPTTFSSSLIMQGDNTRYYDQDPQEVVERSDVQIGLSQSSMIVLTPLKRQRRISSTSPTGTLNTGTTGLRRASMNFNDLPSL